MYQSGTGIGINITTPNATLNVSNSGTLLDGTAMSNTFRSHAGSLGTTAGNDLVAASIGFASGNNSALGVRALRVANGTDWMTTAIGLSMDVDNTPSAGASLWLKWDGNVGIGTTNPVSRLHVNAGSIRISGSTNTNAETGGMLIFDNTSGLGGGTAKKVERISRVANIRTTTTTIFDDQYVTLRILSGTAAYIQLAPKVGYTGNYVSGYTSGTTGANTNCAIAGTFYTISWDIRYSYEVDAWVISKRASTTDPLYIVTLIKNSVNGTSEEAIFRIEAYYP
jgi:hypothetical protein